MASVGAIGIEPRDDITFRGRLFYSYRKLQMDFEIAETSSAAEMAENLRSIGAAADALATELEKTTCRPY